MSSHESYDDRMHHTAATDWLLAESSIDERALHAQASAAANFWYGGVTPLVKSHRGELQIQAQGAAEVFAGQFGSQFGQARSSFMQRVAHLVRTAAGEPADTGETPEDYDDFFEEDRKARTWNEKGAARKTAWLVGDRVEFTNWNGAVGQSVVKEVGVNDVSGFEYVDLEDGRTVYTTGPQSERSPLRLLAHKKTASPQIFVIQRGGGSGPVAGPFINKIEGDSAAEYLNALYGFNPGSNYVSAVLGDYPQGIPQTAAEWRETGDHRVGAVHTAAQFTCNSCGETSTSRNKYKMECPKCGSSDLASGSGKGTMTGRDSNGRFSSQHTAGGSIEHLGVPFTWESDDEEVRIFRDGKEVDYETIMSIEERSAEDQARDLAFAWVNDGGENGSVSPRPREGARRTAMEADYMDADITTFAPTSAPFNNGEWTTEPDQALLATETSLRTAGNPFTTPLNCTSCGKDMFEIDAFPGNVCLDCYAGSPAGQRMPTADEVVNMWGGRTLASRTAAYSEADKAKIMTPGSKEIPADQVDAAIAAGDRVYGLSDNQIIRVNNGDTAAEFYWTGTGASIWNTIRQAHRQASRKVAAGPTYEVRRAADWDGPWHPAGEMFEDAEKVMMQAYSGGPSTLVLLKNNFNGSVTVWEVDPPAFHGPDYHPWPKGDYERFYGQPMATASKTASTKKTGYYTYDTAAIDRGFAAGMAGEQRLPGESMEWLIGYDAAEEGRTPQDAYDEAEAGWEGEEDMYGHDWHGGSMRTSGLGGRTARRHTAAEDDATCSVCGDSITTTDGEHHHDNGEKHDHKAEPGSAKESSRRTATWYCNTHDVYVGDGNRDSHEGCSLEQGTKAESSRRTAADEGRWVSSDLVEEGDDFSSTHDGETRDGEVWVTYRTSSRRTAGAMFEYNGQGFSHGPTDVAFSCVVCGTSIPFGNCYSTAWDEPGGQTFVCAGCGLDLLRGVTASRTAALGIGAAFIPGISRIAGDRPAWLDTGSGLQQEITPEEAPEDFGLGWINVDENGEPIEQENVTASRRTAASFGEQAACAVCGMDIEYHGPDEGWIGRGGDHNCIDSGGKKPVDQYGDPTGESLPDAPHRPYTGSKTSALSPERQAEVENVWYHRKGGWQAPFETILTDVMVGGFYHDDDYDEVKEYLIGKFGSAHTADMLTEVGERRNAYDEIEQRPSRFTDPEGYAEWAARADAHEGSRRTALTMEDIFSEMDADPEKWAADCTVCGARATTYSYEDGYSASGHFACDAHSAQFAPGRIQVAASRRTAVAWDGNGHPPIGAEVIISGGFEDGITGTVVSTRPHVSAGYPVYNIQTANGTEIGGISAINLEPREGSRHTAAGPECIANNGSNGEPEVPLWECPCRECTKMDWEASDDDGTSLAQFRRENWGEHYSSLRTATPVDGAPEEQVGVGGYGDEAMFEADEYTKYDGPEGAAAVIGQPYLGQAPETDTALFEA